MNKGMAAASVGFVVLAALAAWTKLALAEVKDDPSGCGEFAREVDPVPTTASLVPGLNYWTGFEPNEGFSPGFVGDGNDPLGCGGPALPCWGHTTAVDASLITPTIENSNPASGVQHLRLIHDPATRTNRPNFGLGVDARYPRSADLSIRPIAANSVSVDIAISNPGGMNYRIQPQSPSQGCLATSALFMYDGSIHVLDDRCGKAELQFIDTGEFWNTSGAYQNYTVAIDACTNTSAYSYGDAYLYTSCLPAGNKLEQLVIFGDNYPGSYVDLDNVHLSSNEECPDNCGNGILEPPNESCEPGVFHCPLPGGPCVNCRCPTICTLAEPCILTQGANGPFRGPFEDAYGPVFVYEAPDGVDAVSVDLCGSTGIDAKILYFGSCSDLNDPGSTNDDCCNPDDPNCGSYGIGSDPSASCYDDISAPNNESCTCHDNPLAGDNCYMLQVSRPFCADPDPVWHIEVNTKAACGQGHLGSCCDTNGADHGCTDNVVSADCSGADRVWTDQGRCEDVVCECIPDCTGATCGDDGCGGSCGMCDDGNVCNGLETCNANRICDPGTPLVCNDGDACNGVESCNPASGCDPGDFLSCDDGLFCNGEETCNPSSGCVIGSNPCPDDTTCNEDTDNCDPNTIPTVNEWGLLVLALVLLVVAKVSFGRIRVSG